MRGKESKKEREEERKGGEREQTRKVREGRVT